MQITYNLAESSQRRSEPFNPQDDVGFGALRTDHMFLMDYRDGEWCDPRIVPYGPFQIAPGAIALHYGQSVFEGAKAFMHADGEIYTFRLDKNAERLNRSAENLCMPPIPEQIQIGAIHALIDVDRLWFPLKQEACLYIRPFLFATEDKLAVNPSQLYTFAVILSPSGPYYRDGFNKALHLLISKRFHRAVPGGTGSSKAAGNYAASLKAGLAAAEYGASQVLYLDANNEKIEEVGAMNHFHILKDGTVIIPSFTDTILKSITSQSILELQQQLGCEIRQESVMLEQFIADIESGEIIEAGGLGTAAVVSPVGSYIFEDGRVLTVGDGLVGKHTRRLYQKLTGIQQGLYPSPSNWLQKVERNI